jgi:hypothetical protein
MTTAATAAAIALGTTALITGSVLAFPFTSSWHQPASGETSVQPRNRAGAEGLYGTGGRADLGIRCSHCHIKGQGRIDFTLAAQPAFAKVGGEDAYVPGQQYTITITMTGEHRGTGPGGSNMNGMALAIENAAGQKSGTFIADAGQSSASCPANDPYLNVPNVQLPAGRTTFLYGDCHGVLFLPHQDLIAWTFDWIAPAAGSGDLTMFVAVVDGDTAGSSSLDDDVVERALPLQEM